MKLIRRLYYRFVATYRRIELKFVSYAEGDRLIKASVGKPEKEQWVIAREEDTNRCYGFVYLERRERIHA